jgi:hypothetical protein
MADGLLTQGLNYIDQQKQALAARLGLLMNNPQEFASQLGSEARQRAGVGLLGEPKTAQDMASGAWINSPYGQQAMQAGSGFVGSIKPISKAEKLGFNKDVYHFSKTGADINEFVPGMQDLSPFGIGTHVGTKEAAYDRFLKTTKTGATYPLKIKTEREFLTKDGKPFEEEQLSMELRKIIQKIGDDKGIDIQKLPYKEQNNMLSDYMWSKYDAIPYINDVEAKGSISYIVPSQNIRSRFAQFDPAKATSKDILAGVIPFGLITEYDKDQKKDLRKRDIR